MDGFPGGLTMNTPNVTNGLAFQSVTITVTDATIFQETYSKNTLAVWSEVKSISLLRNFFIVLNSTTNCYTMNSISDFRLPYFN